MKKIRIWQIFTIILLILSIILSWSLHTKNQTIERYQYICDEYYKLCTSLIIMLIENTDVELTDLPEELREMIKDNMEPAI